MREGGGAEGHSIHLHSERETNLTISVLSRSRVRHLGCPNGFATPHGAGRVPGVRVCLSIFSQVRSRGDGPRAYAPHLTASKPFALRPRGPPGPAQAAGGTRPAARGPSFSPLAHLLRPPSSCLSVRHPPSSHPLPKERTRA